MKHDTLKTICLSMLCVLGLGCLQAQTWDGTTIAANYAGGDGTKENPFLISNGAELAKLAQDVMAEKDFSLGRYFKLTADIVLNENVNQTAATTLESGNAFPASPVIGPLPRTSPTIWHCSASRKMQKSATSAYRTATSMPVPI